MEECSSEVNGHSVVQKNFSPSLDSQDLLPDIELWGIPHSATIGELLKAVFSLGSVPKTTIEVFSLGSDPSL
jgi:hypothetical protein